MAASIGEHALTRCQVLQNLLILILILIFSRSAGSIFDQQNGEYALQVIVGDFFIQNTVAWDVATLAFSGGADDAGAVPTDRPTIEHQFRKPESRPPEIVSYVFVAAVLAPAAGLLWGFGRCAWRIYRWNPEHRMASGTALG
jgi:hypothetical protein